MTNMPPESPVNTRIDEQQKELRAASRAYWGDRFDKILGVQKSETAAPWPEVKGSKQMSENDDDKQKIDAPGTVLPRGEEVEQNTSKNGKGVKEASSSDSIGENTQSSISESNKSKSSKGDKDTTVPEITREENPVLNRAIATFNAVRKVVGGVAERFIEWASPTPPPPPNVDPTKPAIPKNMRMDSSREVDVEQVRRTVKASGIERAPEVTGDNTEVQKVLVGKLRIPLIFNGTKTVGNDISETHERQVLGGAFKRTQVYEKYGDDMEKTLEKKVNPLRTVTNEIKTDEAGVVTRSKERSNLLGFSDKAEYNAGGRLLVQQSNLAYKMTVQAHPEPDLNPGMRQKTTAVLGMFKGTYNVGADNTLDKTGYSNPLNSSQTTRIENGATKIRQTDLGGIASRTTEKTDDGAAFVTKDRLRGLYKMEATQAKAAEGDKPGVDAKRTIEAGFLGIKAFRQEVVIPHDSDMKTTKTKVFGVTVSKQMTALSDDEKSVRNKQVEASKPKDTLPEQDKPKGFVGALKDAASFANNNRMQTAVTAATVAGAAISLNPLSATIAVANSSKWFGDYNSHRTIKDSASVSTAPVGNVSFEKNRQDSSRSVVSALDDTSKSADKSGSSYGGGILKATTVARDAVADTVAKGISVIGGLFATQATKKMAVQPTAQPADKSAQVEKGAKTSLYENRSRSSTSPTVITI